MNTSQPTNRLPLAALVAVTAGLLTGALWSSQPASVDVTVLDQPNAVIDHSIPSITITAKRMSKAEKAQQAREEIDPAVPHLTVIGYRDRTVVTLVRPI